MATPIAALPAGVRFRRTGLPPKSEARTVTIRGWRNSVKALRLDRRA
jgi:hypothetical protein